MTFYKKNKLCLIALYVFLASLIIEIIQLVTSFNTTDIDDIIFNTLGAIIRYIIFNIFYYLIKKTKLGNLVRVITSSFEIYNIYNGEESKDLKIYFHDASDNEYKDMKLATE
ncbi:VanZ family protein [Clostridium nigeriense]|uniref:VanZ family protein n=1 Tax=Clostridium nigeriense TaxID=1805470 RepID=UPI003D348174